VHLEELERLLDQIAEVLLLALGVIDAVTHVEVVRLEQVHDGKDLTVIRHESFTDGITALDEGLEHMERRADDLVITSVQSRFDRDDELGDDGEDLGLAVGKKVEDALAS